MSRAASLVVLIAALAGMAADPAEAPPLTLACPSGLVVEGSPEGIARAMDQAKPYLTQFSDPQKLRQHPYGIYPLQIATANVMRYAGNTNNVRLLRELVPYFERALSSRTLTSRVALSFVRHPDGPAPKLSIAALSRPVPIWKSSDQANGVAAEYVLPSAQFLYGALRLMRTGSEIAPQDQAMSEFRKNYADGIVADTLLRWIDGPPSFFRHGWGCRDFAENHRGLVQELRQRVIQPVPSQPEKKVLCNAITDADLLVMGMAAEALLLDREPGAAFLSNDQRGALGSYLQAAAALLKQRHIVTDGYAVFDPGGLAAHPDYRYASVQTVDPACFVCRIGKNCRAECMSYPGGRTDVSPPPLDVGWDLSHARRLPLIYDSMRRVRSITGADFPTRNSETQLARQFAAKVWNGDRKKPIFATFFDGTDGWYQVSDANKMGAGYSPDSFSMDVASFGFSFWTPLDENVGAALRSDVDRNKAAVCLWLRGSPSRALELAPELANIAR